MIDSGWQTETSVIQRAPVVIVAEESEREREWEREFIGGEKNGLESK